MKFQFSHNDLSGYLEKSFWSGKSRLYIKGEEVKKENSEWVTTNGQNIQLANHMLFFPKLIIDGKEVLLIKLTWGQWILVLLPMLIIISGGAIPALLGISASYTILNVLISNRSNGKKLFSVIGIYAVTFIILLGIGLLATGLTENPDI